ncbi:GNAT family N-acetyltransferase [Candidatus Raskinella chloraquaticus]|uniref:GNAT family N-acetyltransferase n=1 Tax=Candidatus Raskinella chloraquaticus TaxID=1951219 RepID=UPI0026A2B528
MPGSFIGRGAIRRLWPADREAFAAHLLRLDSDSRRKRFQGFVSDSFLQGYAERSIKTLTVFYGYFDAGTLRAVAELHLIHPSWPAQAEAAFSVEASYQEHGIGSELFKRIIDAARNRSVSDVTFHCLTSNSAMRGLCKKFGGKIVFDQDEAVGTIPSSMPTPMSLMREAISGGVGIAKAMLDEELRLIKAAG